MSSSGEVLALYRHILRAAKRFPSIKASAYAVRSSWGGKCSMCRLTKAGWLYCCARLGGEPHEQLAMLC